MLRILEGEHLISRTVPVGTLNEIEVSMQKLPMAFKDEGLKTLCQVLQTKPRTEMLKRTPMATTRRYTYYIDKTGQAHRANRPMAGAVKALRNAASNGVRVTEDRVEFGVRANARLQYARRVHEMKNPTEGQYWQQGMRGFGRGWTTPGTGNKYVEKPVRENNTYVVEKFNERVDALLEGWGL